MNPNSMQGVVVPKGSFPNRRKTSCCGRQAKAGEVVLTIQVRAAGELLRHVVVHKRCVAALIQELPDDAEDYASRFASIREAVIERGEVFPDRKKRKKA